MNLKSKDIDIYNYLINKLFIKDDFLNNNI